MTDQSVFDNEGKQSQETPDTQSQVQDVFADKLKSIVNEEGKQKYADVSTALDALASSQSFIRTLKEENQTNTASLEQLKAEYKELQERLAQMGSIEDFVKKVSPQPAQETPAPKPEAQPGLQEQDISKYVEQVLAQREKQTQAQQNLDHVSTEIRKVHGDAASDFLTSRAKELGMSMDEIKELSSRSPKAALTLLGGAKTGASPSKTSFFPSEPRNEAPSLPPVPKGKGLTRGGRTNKEIAAQWREVGEYTRKRLDNNG